MFISSSIVVQIIGENYDAFRWGMSHSIIWTTIFFCAVAMFLIYLTFRKQEKAMVTYSRNAGMEANHKQSRMVAMQGMFFVVSFFLAWIFVFVSLLLHWCV